MRITTSLLAFIFLAPLPIYSNAHPWFCYTPFDSATKKTRHLNDIANTEHVVLIDGITLYNFFKTLYEQYNPSKLSITATPTIPKIIHQIWLGSPLPEVYKELMQSWISMHAPYGWQYKLWTDDNIHEITLYNKELYDATQNYGVKSDILRWEILYQYGGLYVDVDYECIRSFDLFHHMYDFYTGMQPLDTYMVQLGAALVGSRPGHPILKYCIETMKDTWHFKGAPQKTGPLHFTRSFYAMAGKNNAKDIAFPPLYVYPLGCRERATNQSMHEWKQQGSFAVHWWSKSWMPKEYRPSIFRTIDNDTSAEHWND